MKVVVCVALLCWLATSAHAQPGNTAPSALPPPSSYQPPSTHTERYGATIALVDGLSMAAVVVGAIIVVADIVGDGGNGSMGVGLMIGGIAGYVAGGPIVHHLKHNDGAVWKSVALRLGLPAVGGLIAAAVRPKTTCSGDVCSTEDSNPGSSLPGIGMVAAMVIDWVLLAKHEVGSTPPMPYVSGGAHGGITFGIAGSF